MNPIQIVLVILALLAWSRALNSLRRGTLSLTPFVLWSLGWAGVIVVSLRPETTIVMARVVGVGRGADLAIYLSLMLVFFLLFRLFARIEGLERQLTQLVRTEALKDLQDPERLQAPGDKRQ